MNVNQRVKIAAHNLDRISLLRQARDGIFDDLSDEDFARKLDIIPENRENFVAMLRYDPEITAVTVTEIVDRYLLKLITRKVMIKQLSELSYSQGYFADSDEIEPEDYVLGSWDKLVMEVEDFHSIDVEAFKEIEANILAGGVKIAG